MRFPHVPLTAFLLASVPVLGTGALSAGGSDRYVAPALNAQAGEAEQKPHATARPSTILETDHRALVSSSDILYHAPTAESVEGQPIGNGRMGTLVWTTPGALHFQIDRGDVFAADSSPRGAQYGPTDYCGACAPVAVEVGGEAFAPSEAFTQRNVQLYCMASTSRGTLPSKFNGMLFPAWRRDWDGAFRLLARGGFLVTSQRRGGAIRFVQSDSRVGETCRLRNPWGQACVRVDADGSRRERSGPVLRLETRPDGRYLVHPANLPEPKPERLAAPRPKPAAFRFTLPLPTSELASGVRGEDRTLEGRIGKRR